MYRSWSGNWANNRTAIEVAILVLLVVASLFIIRHFNHHAQAASLSTGNNGSVHSLNISATNQTSGSDTQDSSAPAEESFVSGQSTGNSRTSLTVNGQNIPLPENGSISQSVPNDNGGTTQVNASSSSSSSSSSGAISGQATNSNQTSVNINVSSGDGL